MKIGTANLLSIIKKRLAPGYISKVNFIPKTVKENGTEPISFRPNSQTSFLLKAIEKVVPNYFTMEILEKVPLHLHQNAYRAGRSTDTMHSQLNSIDLHTPEISSKKLMQCSY